MHRISKLGIFLILLFVSLIIYSHSLYGDFLFDDIPLISANEDIRHIRNIPLLFNSGMFKFAIQGLELSYNYYRPLQTLSYAIVYHICGLNPFGYHFFNIVIHALNAFLLFCIVYKLWANYSLALLSSIIFCVHPIHTESVSYISSLGEVLVSLFLLLSIINYLWYAESKKVVTYIISMLCVIFALLSRETGFLIFMPFIISVLGLRAKIEKDSLIIHFISFAGIILTYILLRLTILVPLRSIPSSTSSIGWDILNFFNIFIEYVKLLVFPNSLHIFRSIVPFSASQSSRIILYIFLLIMLTIVFLLLIKKKKYILVFSTSWFVLGLIHLIKFMHKFPGFISMEEHWIYFASMGFFVALSYAILSIRKPKLILIISIFIVGVYSYLAFVNSKHWNDSIGFYRYNLKLIQRELSIIPRLNFSIILGEAGYYGEAIEQVNYTLTISSANPTAYFILGDTYRKMKKFPEAKEAYKNALKIDFFCWEAGIRLKQLAKETGESFIDDLEPWLSPAEANIISLIRLAKFNEALGAIRKELAVSPSPKFYTLAGITFGKAGLYDRAIDAFNAALKLDSKFSPALYNLMVIYGRQMDYRRVEQIKIQLKQYE